MAQQTKAARIRERLNLAVEDVRANGKAGRSVAQIAALYKVNSGSLKVRLGKAGLLGPQAANLRLFREAQEREETSDSGQAPSGSDSLAIKGLNSGIPASGGIEGGEGGNPLKGGTGASGEARTDEDRLKGLTSEVRRVIESSIRAGAKVLKCETPGDLERLYKLYRETFKSLDGESSGPGRGLIQVQILGDASAPAPRQVRVIEAQSSLISDSPSESASVSPASEAGQGPE